MEKRTTSPPEQPVWLRTAPPANPEVDEKDLERSLERLEMLLGH